MFIYLNNYNEATTFLNVSYSKKMDQFDIIYLMHMNQQIINKEKDKQINELKQMVQKLLNQ